MEYNIINNLPIDYKFSTKSKKELKLYEQWFWENKDKRISELFHLVSSTMGFENWVADFTPDSLKELGSWLKQNTETEKIPEEEFKKKRAEIPAYIEVGDRDLTIKTRSFLVDAGIYFGEVFIHTYPNLKLDQYFSKLRNDNNQGHMVVDLGKKKLNPIWILYIIGLGFADTSEDELSIFNTFNIWSKYLK